MGTILRNDDFEVGMLICQHTGPTVERMHAPQYGDLQRWEEEDTTATGIPLELLAINLPFLCVLVISTGQRVMLDSREVLLMRCSESYARALTPDAFDRWQAGKHLPKGTSEVASTPAPAPPVGMPPVIMTAFSAFPQTFQQLYEKQREACTCASCIEWRRKRDAERCEGK